MRRFLKKCILFALPLLIIFGALLFYAEVTLQNYPSAFQTKAKHFYSNKNQIEILVLGSSHNQTAINPSEIENFEVSNLAFGGQTIAVDYLLLKNYIHQLPNLKAVVLELSYHSLEHEQSSSYHRNSLYLRFYGLNSFDRTLSLLDYSIYFSNPKFYTKFLNPFVERPKLNMYGFPLNSSKNGSVNRFASMQYDTLKILSDTNNQFILRHKSEDVAAYERNISLFEEMIRICVENKIVPIVLSPPVYKNYFQSYLKNKELRRINFISKMEKKYTVLYHFNFDNHNAFEVTDFKNEDHLNLNGAEKFSKVLNSKLNLILSDS